MSDSKVMKSALHYVGKPPTSPPPSKLLISHGKPNFTIQRANKTNVNKCENPTLSENEFSKIHRQISNGRSGKDLLNGNSVSPDKPDNTFDKVKLRPVSPISVPKPKVAVQKELGYAKIEEEKRPVLTLDLQTSQPELNGNISVPETLSVSPPKIAESPTKPSVKPKPAYLSLKSREYDKNSTFVKNSLNGNDTSKWEKSPNTSSAESSLNNFENKSYVSFSRELRDTPNNYPDFVSITKIGQKPLDPEQNKFVREFSKLKFQISGNGDLIKPVIKDEIK